MANTVYGPFTAINVVQGVTPANATWGNNAQTQASVALHGLNPDFSGAFVHSGITCARNGVTLNQLDVATGIAYLAFSDGTVGKIAVGASTAGQFVTSVINTTYYLFLKNDGTWQWSTTSTTANAIPICTATTDGSGNINVVTDVRHTAGSPGVPYLVGNKLRDQTVADAAVHNFTLVSAIPVTGLYRISGQFYIAAGALRKHLFSLSFTQGHSGSATSKAFVSTNTTGGLLWDASGSGDSASAGDAVGSMMVLYLQAGSTLTLRFQDAGWTSGTNLISGVCERVI